MTHTTLTNDVVRLHGNDNVVVAIKQFLPGQVLFCEDVRCRNLIPPGHKIAVARIPTGQPVYRYNQIIGFAAKDIEIGDHVHTHNVSLQEFSRVHDFCSDLGEAPKVATPATFMGYRRPDGKYGTRNYIAVLASVNCASTVARTIAAYFNQPRIKQLSNVDCIIALPQASGCGMDMAGEGMAILRRTIVGYANHPNIAGVLLVGLGCEHNQIEQLLPGIREKGSGMVASISIQGEGGTSAAIARGIHVIDAMLECANALRREEAPISHLIVGLNCGGSDGYSGITANPALGVASDLLVAHGATTVLSETPEIYGAEHLLTSRSESEEVAQMLVDRINWWKDYTASAGGEMNNNPSVGNKAGGLTTILEKSLGAISKSGTSPLRAVCKYAEPITSKGLVFMDTPGYDPVSITGQAAGGAQIICFTTGRGSAIGCAAVPTIKITTNTDIYLKMAGDMDVNCGDILDGVPIETAGRRIFEAIIRHASGEKVRSEVLGYGQDEFLPWHLGAVM